MRAALLGYLPSAIDAHGDVLPSNLADVLGTITGCLEVDHSHALIKHGLKISTHPGRRKSGAMRCRMRVAELTKVARLHLDGVEVQVWNIDIPGSQGFWRQVTWIRCWRTLMKLVASTVGQREGTM